MLKSLIVHNYSLIEELHINFSTGFSVITGETGAGKSIMLGALGLLLGQRADSKAIRKGAAKCVVEGHFQLNSNRLKSFFQENDFEYDASECIIRREVYASGKSRAFINDTPAQLTQLKELGEQLIDIHSQHKNLLLNKESFQLEILDTMAHHEDLLQTYKEQYTLYLDIANKLKERKEQIRKNKEEEDFLNFQFSQLEEADLKAGEQEELEEEQELLSHAEDIKEALYSCTTLLQDSENAVLSQLRNVQSTLRGIQQVYSPAQEWMERLESTYIELKDIAGDIEGRSDDVEFNPERLSFVNERLNTLYSLEKKHHLDHVEELIALKEELQQKLDIINNSEEDIVALEKKLEISSKRLKDLSQQLTKNRIKSADSVIEKLKASLSMLGMPNVQFRIQFSSTHNFKANGCDEVCFLFNANKGGELQDLSQIASGGEIARVMLSLKALMAGAADLPTLIFDEIDTGVSGSIAEKMALIMKQMCEQENRQVLSITHLPQIAAQGKIHYKVYKEDKNEVTVSHIIELSPEQRIEEIAHMLSGEDLTEAAINNAKALLKN